MKPLSFILFSFFLLVFVFADTEELIPEDKIDAKAFHKAQDILKNHSIKRHLPRTKVKSKVTIYEYMLNNLELTSKMVRFLKLGEYTVEKELDGRFKVDDQKGVIAKLECIYKTDKMQVYLAEGIFQIAFNLEIKAEGLIIMKYVARPTYVDTKATLFFKVENRVLDQLTKSAHEIVGSILEKKSSIFISASKTMAEYIKENATQFYYEMEASKEFSKEELESYYQEFLTPKRNTLITYE